MGSLAAGGAAAMGSGAFTSVEAERTIDIETTGDANALLEIKPNDDYEGDPSRYLSWTDDGRLEIDPSKVNKDAVTKFKDLIKIRNTGGKDLSLYILNDFGERPQNDDEADPIRGSGYGSNGPVDILHDGDSIVGGNPNQVTGGPPSLDSGSSVTLTLVVDTRNLWEDYDELSGDYKIIAE